VADVIKTQLVTGATQAPATIWLVAVVQAVHVNVVDPHVPGAPVAVVVPEVQVDGALVTPVLKQAAADPEPPIMIAVEHQYPVFGARHKLASKPVVAETRLAVLQPASYVV